MNIRRFEKVTEETVLLLPTSMQAERSAFQQMLKLTLSMIVKEMARNVAMQAAALKPTFTNRDEVSPEFIEHEKAILIAQIQNDPKEASKPEKVIQGMIQ